MIKREIVESVSPRHVRRLLAEADLKPHRIRVSPSNDENFDNKVKNITELYVTAPERAEAGERTLSTDEKTSIQALERVVPDLPMCPGRVLMRLRKRHGTQTLTVNFDVVNGQIVIPTIGNRLPCEDFKNHICRTVGSDPEATKWNFIVDGLNTHKSASLVEFVAQYEELEIDLGVKGKTGILKSMKTREAKIP